MITLGNTFGFATRARWAQGSQSRKPLRTVAPTLNSTPTRSFRLMPRVTMLRRKSAARCDSPWF